MEVSIKETTGKQWSRNNFSTSVLILLTGFQVRWRDTSSVRNHLSRLPGQGQLWLFEFSTLLMQGGILQWSPCEGRRTKQDWQGLPVPCRLLKIPAWRASKERQSSSAPESWMGNTNDSRVTWNVYRAALDLQPPAVLHVMLDGSSGKASATFLCYTSKQGRVWCHFYPTCGDPDLLTAKEFCFWERQKHLHTHRARGTSPRMEGVTEQLSQPLITLITYQLA